MLKRVFTINKNDMHKSIEKLAYKIAEAVQGDNLSDNSDKINIYHRKVTGHNGADLAYANGVITTGLRASALISGSGNSVNFNSFLSSQRQHLPLVVNLDCYNSSIRAYESLNCFIFVAASAKEHLNLNLLAHKVSELSLVPGFVIANYPATDEKVDLPADELLKNYLGNPDDQIECPTPAQRIVFGTSRRRIPNWYSLDLPVMLGTRKTDTAEIFEAMASEKYFADHLQDIITRAIAEFKAVFGEDLTVVSVDGKKSGEAILTNSGLVVKTYKTSELKKAPQFIKLNQVKPVPEEALHDALQSKTSITLIENSELGGSSSYLNRQIVSLFPKADIYSARLGTSFSGESLEAVINHMYETGSLKEYFVALPFTKSKSEYPKHEILLQEVAKQYPDLKNASVGQAASTFTRQSEQPVIPAAVRQHLDRGPNYSKLSGFYDNTAFFYQQAEENELVADPFSALPLTPAGSAGFFRGAQKRTHIPHFRPAKSQGNGGSFVHCPHAALMPIVIGIEPLMKEGMALAAAKGHTLSKLTPMLKNLAKLAGKSVEEKTENLADFLPTAFESLCKQMKLEGENLELVKNEFNLVVDELKALPVAITDTFYNTPEATEKGSGELFSVVVNPATCTGCGICAEACEDEAINIVEEDAELLSNAEAAFRLWEALPTVTASTIERLHESDYNPLATLLLPKENFNTMTGGSKSEVNNAYKTLIHLVTAAASNMAAPKQKALASHINELIESISEKVHESLSNALPKENLEALSMTLRETRSQKTSFHEIVDRLEELGQQKMVDTRELQRKTDLVDALKELSWVIKEGPTGMGRATFGLYLTGSEQMSWAQEYPLNNFTVPAVVQWQSSAPEQVLGLVNGHIRHQIDNIKLIRRAEMEAAGKYDPAAHDLEIAALDWDRLTEDERNSIPPILIVGDREDVNSSGWQSLNKLLATEYPVKVILLDHIAPPAKDSVASLSQSYSGLINAIATKKAFVFQGSIADSAHMAKGLISGMAEAKPALLNLYAYNEALHGSEATDGIAYAHLAVNSRTFPLLSFSPDKEHGFLNGTINLDANRNNREDWIDEEIKLPTEESLAYKITWADWAFTQEAWKSEFKKVESGGNNVPVAEFVKMSAKDRANKIPVIMRSTQKGLVNYSASRIVVRMTETVLDNWNTLQELAGLITEFPVKLSEEVKKELANKFDQDVAELRKEYDQKLKEQEQEFMSKMRVQIRERLVQLSKMAKN